MGRSVKLGGHFLAEDVPNCSHHAGNVKTQICTRFSDMPRCSIGLVLGPFSRRFFVLFLLLALSAPNAHSASTPKASFPVKGVAAEGEVEGVFAYRLKNGLRVLLVPEPSASSVTVEVAYSVGSRHEGYGEAGMAHLLEHLLFKGTARFPKPDAEIDRRGGSWNAETEVDQTRYYQTHLPSLDNLRLALSIEADRMTQVRIRQADLDREFQVVRNELELADSEPRDLLARRLHHAAYVIHGYGKDPIGTRSDIERARVERLQAFYARHYRPDNAHLVIGGPIERAKTLALVAELFAPIRPQGPPPEKTHTEEPAQDGERFVTVRRVGKLPLLAMYFHTASVADPDQAALSALSYVLARPGSGRLYKALVETGLAVSVSAENELRAEPGGFLLFIELRSTTDPQRVQQIVAATLSELVQHGITDTELRRFFHHVQAEHHRLSCNPIELVHALSIFATLGDFRLLFYLRNQALSVTAEQVQTVAQRYFVAQNRTTALFLPEKVPPPKTLRATAEVQAALKTFQPGGPLQTGEPFVQAPKNLAQRLVERTLDNGLRLILVPKATRGQQVEWVLSVPFGNEPSIKGKEAVVSLLAPLLGRGTQSLDYDRFLDELDVRKGTFAATTRASIPGQLGQHLDLSGRTVRSELPALLSLVSDVVKQPGLRPAEFERVRQQAVAQTEELIHNPMAQALLHLFRHATAFPPNDPRYLPTTDEQLARLAQAKFSDVRFVAQDLLGGQQGRLVLVGDFDPNEVLTAATKQFGSFVAKQPFARLPRPYKPVSPADVRVPLPDKDSAAAAILLPFPLADDHPDFPALVLWHQVFGAQSVSRLNQRLREKEGLSYEVQSFLQIPTKDNGAFLAALATCAAKNGPKTLAAMREELRRLLEQGPTQEELAQAITGYDKQLDAMLAEDDDLAEVLSRLAFVGRDIRYIDDLRARIHRVTLSQVTEAGKRHLANAPLLSALTHE